VSLSCRDGEARSDASFSNDPVAYPDGRRTPVTVTAETVNEDVQEKAATALLAGKLDVTHRSLVEGRERLRATCVPSKGGRRYELSLDESGSIRCTCPARRLCYHVWALALVVGRSA
jgi:uncharacterized Zn finger protein